MVFAITRVTSTRPTATKNARYPDRSFTIEDPFFRLHFMNVQAYDTGYAIYFPVSCVVNE